jgi:hypothetical protein
MSDDYDDTDYFQIVDVENELEKRRNESQPEIPNIVGTPTKKLGCLAVFVKVIIGLVLFRGILEFFSFFL